MKTVVYIIKDSQGFLSDWDRALGEPEHTEKPENAAIFSKVGALQTAKLCKGVVYSYNIDTGFMRKVNH